jgi:hypothetical protein
MNEMKHLTEFMVSNNTLLFPRNKSHMGLEFWEIGWMGSNEYFLEAKQPPYGRHSSLFGANLYIQCVLSIFLLEIKDSFSHEI